MTVYKWSTTAATNDDVDSTINWQEGQSPASVNNSARAMMAAIAKFRDDMSGNLVTAGTSTAYTLTTNQVFTALTDGLFVAARMDETNGASPTLNVDGLGAAPIASVLGTAVGTGKLRANGVYVFVYDSGLAAWTVQGDPNATFESGTKILFRQTAAPVGWTKDTTYTDAALRVTSGTISQQATGGKEFSTLFASRTISEANLPSHTHGVTGTTGTESNDHTHTANYSTRLGSSSMSHSTDPTPAASGSGSDTTAPTITTSGVSASHTHFFSVTSAATGSGTAMAFDVNFVDVIIATRD